MNEVARRSGAVIDFRFRRFPTGFAETVKSAHATAPPEPPTLGEPGRVLLLALPKP